MSRHAEVEQLLRDSRVWKAGSGTIVSRKTIATGWRDLDNALGGGWPLGELTEFLVDMYGFGEFTLLLPALRNLIARGDRRDDAAGWAALVAPPYMPYAPALAGAGLDVSRLLLVRTDRDIDTLWAVEQALCARSCSAVVAWVQAMDAKPLRRLQLAAESGNAWAVLFRPARARRWRSPAALRIQLTWEQAGGRLVLSVLKRRGGTPLTVAVQIGQ